MRDPVRVALFSGGHDSLCATHYAMTNGLAEEVAHVNTGIGVEQTREFVRTTCAEHGWPLTELRPPISYDEIVLTYGFPGPAQHFTVPSKWVGMYVRLKERALAAHARERKPKRGWPLIYVTGARRDESDRRMENVDEEWQHAPKKGWTWHAPILDWSKADCNRYIQEQGLRRNEVVDILHMSGECLCGCFARPGERDEIRRWFPEANRRIEELERRVAAAGLDADVWGARPPAVIPGQLRMEQQPLCRSCPSMFSLVGSGGGTGTPQ